MKKFLTYIVVFLFIAVNTKGMPAISFLLPINGDTIMALKWDGGISITYNAGLNWDTIYSKKHFKYIAFDNNRVLWGLNSWQGIHEADYSIISKSIDLGKTWEKKEFNTNIFFPLEIISNTNEQLKIITNSYEEYLLTGYDLDNDWSLVRKNKDFNKYKIYDNYKVSNYNNKFKGILYKENKSFLGLTNNWDSIYHLPNFTARTIYSKRDTIFIGGSTKELGQGEKAYFCYIIGNEKKEFNFDIGYAITSIKEDSYGRIWIHSTYEIFILENGKLRKVY